MTVLAAVREREARRIGESSGGAVHNLGDQCQRLQRPRAQILQQQQRCEVAELALVGRRQHRPEALEIDISGAHVVVPRHRQLPRLCEGDVGILADDREERTLRGRAPRYPPGS